MRLTRAKAVGQMEAVRSFMCAKQKRRPTLYTAEGDRLHLDYMRDPRHVL